MKPISRFHFLYSFQYIRYAFFLSVLPLVRALLVFDLPSLFTALKQDGIIFIVVAIFSFAQWKAAGYRCGKERIFVEQGVLFHRQLIISRRAVAAIELKQPLYARIFGACLLTIYFKQQKKQVSYWLFRKDAATLAHLLLPINRHDNIFRPVGSERLSFSLLSANLITTGVLLAASARKTTELLGDDFNRFAFSNLERLEQLLEALFPVSAAWIATFIFVLVSIAVGYSFLHTAGFEVCRNGGVIVARGGLITKTERRILASAVTACDVRTTPFSRILRRSPVYLHAGGFSGNDMPLMVYRKGCEQQLERLMPEFRLAPLTLAPVRGRSLMQFLWMPGTFFLLFASLAGVAAWLMPDAAPFFSLPAFLCLLSTLISVEGFFLETVHQTNNRTLQLCFTRFLTRHRVCVFGAQAGYRFTQNPLLYYNRRCNFRLRLPCGLQFRVRGMPDNIIDQLPMVV